MPDPSRKLIDVAKAEAEALGHPHISTEHVLLAVAGEPDGTAASVLKELGATPESIRAAVLALSPPGESPPRARLPFTPDAKRTLESALNAARALASDRIESTHLLLGLLSNEAFVAARVLHAVGLSPARVRAAVLKR